MGLFVVWPDSTIVSAFHVSWSLIIDCKDSVVFWGIMRANTYRRHPSASALQDYLMNAESPQLSSADQNRSDDSVGLPRTTSLHIMLSPVSVKIA